MPMKLEQHETLFVCIITFNHAIYFTRNIYFNVHCSGCGKTMLMDLFYDCCTLERKHRAHFHEFMVDIHQRIHTVKQDHHRGLFSQTISSPFGSKKSTSQAFDPIPPVADRIVQKYQLICFDEFQVSFLV